MPLHENCVYVGEREPAYPQMGQFAGTQLAQATCGTIRLKLLKIGALVRISVRRVKLAMASGCPFQNEWRTAYHALAR